MYKVKFIINNSVVEELDTDIEHYSYLPIIEPDNLSGSFSVSIKNLINQSSNTYPKTLVFKVNISPSIQISSGKKFNMNVSLSNSTLGTFSSDKFAVITDDYVGIIFSEDQEVIKNFRLIESLQNKFILIPYTIKPQEEIVLRFDINYLDFDISENFSRNKFIPLSDFLYSASKKFITTIENYLGRDLTKFYRSYAKGDIFFIVSPTSLQSLTWNTKDLALFHLVANGTFKNANGSFNNFLLNFEHNIISNLIISSVSSGPIPFFSTEIIETNNSLMTSSNLQTKPTKDYLIDLFYLLIYEFLKPYTVNANYIPSNTLNNVDYLSSLLKALLDIGFKQDQIKDFIDQSSGSFFGENLTKYDKNAYLTILYLISLMFVEYVRKLEERNILQTIPNSFLNLETFLFLNVDLFLESSGGVNSSNKLHESYELDYILTLLIALLVYSYEGKHIFKDINKLIRFFTSIFSYFTNLTKLISEHISNIDPNTETFTNQNINVTALLNQIFLIGFWNSISTHNLLKINISNIFNTPFNFLSFDYLANRANILIDLSDLSSIYKGKVLSNSTNTDFFILPDSSIESKLEQNKVRLNIDLNYFNVLLDNNTNIILSPKLTTRVGYLNYLNLYLKFLASKVNNIYYFTRSASNEDLAIVNMNTYAYINYIMLLMLNNKETQNIISIKFSLSTI